MACAAWPSARTADGLQGASWDGTIKLWDATSGQETLTLKGHAKGVLSVAFSPDGKRIVSGSDDSAIKVWEAETGQETLTLKGHLASVFSVAFSPDGKRIISGSDDNTIKVWDAPRSQEPVAFKGHTDFVSSVAFSPDGKQIASGGWDRTIKVWDAGAGQEMLTLKGHDDGVSGVAFSPDGKRIASGSWNGTIKVWDAATGQETLTLKGHAKGVRSVAFSPDGKRIISGSYDETLKVWDAATGQETLTLKGHTQGVRSVAFSPDGKRIINASDNGTIKVWDAATSQETLMLKGLNNGVYSVAFSPDGKRAVSGVSDRISVWDVATGQETIEFGGNGATVCSVAFSPDSKRIATGAYDRISVWDVATGQETLVLRGHGGDVYSVAFSPDGTRIASGGADGTVKIWDGAMDQGPPDTVIPARPLQVDMNQPPPPDPQIPADVTSLYKQFPRVRMLAPGGVKPSWSPDGRQVAFSNISDGGISIVDVRTLAVSPLVSPGCDPAWSPRDANLIAFVSGLHAYLGSSRDDELICVANTMHPGAIGIARGGWPVWAKDGKSLYFYSRKEKKILRQSVSSPGAKSVSSPGQEVVVCDMPYNRYPPITTDGKRTAYLDHEELVVLDIQTRKPLAKRHLGKWRGILAGWSPDGKLLGYGEYGGSSMVGLWLMKVETGQVVQVAEGPYTAPAWSPGGSKLAFDRRGSESSEIWMIQTQDLEKLWDAKPETPAPGGLPISLGTEVTPSKVPKRMRVPGDTAPPQQVSPPRSSSSGGSSQK